MDDITKYRLLKTVKLALHGLESPDEVHATVREATGRLGIPGRGIRTMVVGVEGRMVRRSFVPFGIGDPQFEPDDAAIRCIGYKLVAYERFRADNIHLLYLDSRLDNVGQYRRIEICDGAVVEVCRSGLLGEGDVVGHLDDEAVAAHPLSHLLGQRLRWFVRTGEESVFGFGEYAFYAIAGQIRAGGDALLHDWKRFLHEGNRADGPVLLGYEDPTSSRP